MRSRRLKEFCKNSGACIQKAIFGAQQSKTSIGHSYGGLRYRRLDVWGSQAGLSLGGRVRCTLASPSMLDLQDGFLQILTSWPAEVDAWSGFFHRMTVSMARRVSPS